MLERDFQKNLIKELKKIFPGCVVMKNDSSYIQGIPDLTVLYHDKWAFLECKASEKDYRNHQQPNQDLYISKANEDGSFARFIYPENKEEVIYELQQAFRA